MFFFFNDTATTEIYTLSLHDALPIYARDFGGLHPRRGRSAGLHGPVFGRGTRLRSEEHTSELQSQSNLVCRLLLEKKINDAETTVRHKLHAAAVIYCLKVTTVLAIAT